MTSLRRGLCFSVAVLLIAFAGPIPLYGEEASELQSNEPQRPIVRLTQEELDRLPVFGKVVLSDNSSIPDIDVGNCFVGVPRGGVIQLQNQLPRDIAIQGTSTSCGCTAVHSSEDLILQGAVHPLLVGIRTGKSGKFRNRVSLKTNQEEYTFYLVGSALEYLHINASDVVYAPESSAFVVPICINDPAIAADDVRLYIGDQELPKHAVQSVSGKVSFLIATTYVKAGVKTSVVPRLRDKEMAPVLLPLVMPGELSLAQHQLYTDGETLRPIFTGDVVGRSFEKMKLYSGRESIDVQVKTIVRGQTAMCVCKLSGHSIEDGEILTLELDSQKYELKVFLK